MVPVMDIFPAANLPGVGMGSTYTLVGMGGLVGLAVTSGALIAEGLIGTLLYVAAALSVLSNKPGTLTDRPEVAGTALTAIVVLALMRGWLRRRAAAQASTATAVADGRGIQLLSIAAVAIGGASLGYAWAEWNNLPFSFHSTEALVGALVGLGAAAIGGHAANLFVSGSVRAGGSAGIVGIAVAFTALVVNGAAFYVPFVGWATLFAAIFIAVRLQRRAKAKYKGLRMLNG